ncbi:MAG TPA: glycosyltransferase family 9 protein [Burkholderiales bacterium]|nr:glycosyltransferase family 9 protein [Burkholderiales bacterium]
MNEAPRRILLVATRRIGDVLLATPLLRSLRRAWPRAALDALVYAGTERVLEGNPDCDRVLTIAQRPTLAEHLRLLRRLWRGYDLAVASQQSDRSHLYAWCAGRRRVGLVPDARAASAWKRASCADYELLDDVGTHTVVQNLRLADRLGIARCYEVVPPAGSAPANAPVEPYAVVHPVPKFEYKRWTQEGWARLIEWLRGRGLGVVLTSGPDESERAVCAALAGAPGVTNLGGQLSLAALAGLLRRARLYIGPDTSVTHLAAACGIPTLALYGPSNPVKWGPWPTGCTDDPSPWRMLGRPWQRRGNVLLLQGVQPADLGNCLPCRLEGCERHVASKSRCLTELPPDPVIAAAKELLNRA